MESSLSKQTPWWSCLIHQEYRAVHAYDRSPDVFNEPEPQLAGWAIAVFKS